MQSSLSIVMPDTDGYMAWNWSVTCWKLSRNGIATLLSWDKSINYLWWWETMRVKTNRKKLSTSSSQWESRTITVLRTSNSRMDFRNQKSIPSWCYQEQKWWNLGSAVDSGSNLLWRAVNLQSTNRDFSMEFNAWGEGGFIPISRIRLQGLGSSQLGEKRKRQAYAAGNWSYLPWISAQYQLVVIFHSGKEFNDIF